MLSLRSVLRRFTHLLFPPRCVLCRRRLPTGAAAMLCTDCAPVLRRDYRNTAPVWVRGADGADAPLRYDGQIASALKRYKFYEDTSLGRWFAAQCAACLAAHLEEWQPELITFVPIGAGRWWKRGFNQTETVAREIGKTLSLPVAATLGKRPFQRKQSHRTAAERKQARDIFYPLPGRRVDEKCVVLIEDVIATGATAADAVRALREGGARQVYVLSITRSGGRPKKPASSSVPNQH